jgi:hypothetical protein
MLSRRTVKTKWRQVLRGSAITGTKEDESTNGRFWAAGFDYVTASCLLQAVLQIMKLLFI